MKDRNDTYMNRVRDYYRKREGLSPMTTNEVIKRILGNRQQDSGLDKNPQKANGIILDYELDELLVHKAEANSLWAVSGDRPITSHRKGIGSIIVFGKKVVRKLLRWYINPIIEEQNKYNAQITGALNELYNKMVLTQGNFGEVNKRLEDLYQQFEQFSDEIQLAMKDMDKEHTERFQKAFSQLQSKQESDFSYITYKMKKLQIPTSSLPTSTESQQISSEFSKVPANDNQQKPNKTEMDYFLFENKFRGSERDIKDNVIQYIKYFEQQDALDIGCGRGEFLELLAEKGIKAVGIDIYKDFVDYCSDKGLNAVHTDALSYLRSVPDNSLGGIFLGQVIEHLEQDYLMELIELSYQKLRVGAHFIAETPNPTNLTTFTNSFYLDLSHVKPIHPETMKFLLHYFGFKEANIVFSEKSKIQYELPVLDGDDHIANLQGFNDGINLINNLLFGYQDYAIIGKK